MTTQIFSRNRLLKMENKLRLLKVRSTGNFCDNTDELLDFTTRNFLIYQLVISCGRKKLLL